MDQTASIRQIFYMAKHTIKGTKEKTFDDQAECDPILEDLEVAVESLREELHVFASSRGNHDLAPITFVDSRCSTIDCATKLGSGGYAIPSIVRAGGDPVQEVQGQVHPARRKGHSLAPLRGGSFLGRVTAASSPTVGANPPRGVRRLLYRMHNELKLPVYRADG